ncbi:hypothetical protein [Microbacterium sp. Root1433D1]|uniref:hypothetical protein n=1 Tax=Microbacterium sp. Root1433D1 TaxID=1736463 RepID=UPI000A9061B2|nr:hypothetical protein [Microbacterium sp. Root1433D1]
MTRTHGSDDADPTVIDNARDAAVAPSDPRASARALLIVAVSGGLYGWSLGWDYGAFGIEIGYRRMFEVVVISLIVLVLSLTHRRVLRARIGTRVLLLLPVLYVGTALLLSDTSIAGEIAVLASSLLLLVSLPFILIVLARMLDLDFFRLSKRDQWLAGALIVVVTVLGAVAGTHHNRLVTCDEFERAGDYVPPGCLQIAIEQPVDLSVSLIAE